MKRKKGFILISVFNKKGVAKFAQILKSLGYEIISTKGTGKELTKNKISFIPTAKITNNPKGFDDCIKTISFPIEAGILFNRSNHTHNKIIKNLKIKPINIVICNFPSFKEVVKNIDTDFNIKNVDVGGPLMIRAAAVNFKNVLVITDPNDYKKVAKAILQNKITDKFRQELATKAFNYLYSYDYQISKYLKKNISSIR